MKVHLQYGVDGLDIQLSAPDADIDVVEPRFVTGLTDEAAEFLNAVNAPIGAPSLRTFVGAGDTVAVVIPDITRPFPSDRVLPWFFDALPHVPADRFTVIVGTGSHRGNTAEELARMVGPEILRRYRVVNHDAFDRATMREVGRTAAGVPVFMHADYVRATRRILLGFVEPHFFAGFSGGYKAVMPGIVDIDSVMHYHRAELIGHPASTWGVVEENPTQAHVRSYGALVPAHFAVQVTMNCKRQITRFFCGEVLQAHSRACDFNRKSAMAPCPRPYPVVISTNGGYPLDQNLYQAVKGMAAAAEVVEEGGLIVCAARCNDGFPSHGNFRGLLFDHSSPAAILKTVTAPGFSMFDQWEAQKLALLLTKARIALYSELSDEEVQRAHLEPVHDIPARVAQEMRRLKGHGRIAVLPEGPLTIPYLAGHTCSR